MLGLLTKSTPLLTYAATMLRQLGIFGSTLLEGRVLTLLLLLLGAVGLLEVLVRECSIFGNVSGACRPSAPLLLTKNLIVYSAISSLSLMTHPNSACRSGKMLFLPVVVLPDGSSPGCQHARAQRFLVSSELFSLLTIQLGILQVLLPNAGMSESMPLDQTLSRKICPVLLLRSPAALVRSPLPLWVCLLMLLVAVFLLLT